MLFVKLSIEEVGKTNFICGGSAEGGVGGTTAEGSMREWRKRTIQIIVEGGVGEGRDGSCNWPYNPAWTRVSVR